MDDHWQQVFRSGAGVGRRGGDCDQPGRRSHGGGRWSAQRDQSKGKTPTWSEDGKTCVLPVQLKPDWDYFLGRNSDSHKNFQSKWGVPLEPVPYRFSTRAG